LKKAYLISLAFLLVFSSCATFNPSVMFRDHPDFHYDKFVTGPDSLYRLAENDILNVRILTNNGENLINVTGDVENTGSSESNNQFGGIPILVEFDGTSKLPLIGRVKLAGLTRREAEDKLQDLYKGQYKDPYVTITLSNRKVMVFPGANSNAKVVHFTSDNMNLLQALAEVGGISNTGRAKKVKLIRGDLKNPKVYRIDLSTLEGMKEADLALQSGDIIYVDPYEDPALIFGRNITPYLTAITSVAAVITSVALIIALTK
jgi:polysaccharide export outer membrane protein